MKTIVSALFFLFAFAAPPADAWWERGHSYRHHHYHRQYRYRLYRYDYYPRRHDFYDRQRYCCNDDRYEVGRERPRQTFRLKKPDGTEIETVR